MTFGQLGKGFESTLVAFGLLLWESITSRQTICTGLTSPQFFAGPPKDGGKDAYAGDSCAMSPISRGLWTEQLEGAV